MSVRSEDGGETFSADFRLPADFVGFQGHFPGHPVLPGICIIMACLVAGELATDTRLSMQRLKTAKFFTPVTAGRKIEMRGLVRPDSESGLIRLSADLTSNGEKVAQVRLFARAEASPANSFGESN